jgi:hypothetical protein
MKDYLSPCGVSLYPGSGVAVRHGAAEAGTNTNVFDGSIVVTHGSASKGPSASLELGVLANAFGCPSGQQDGESAEENDH